MFAFTSPKEIRLSKNNVIDTVVYKLGCVYILVRQSRFFRVCGVYWSAFFYIARNLCTESAVPEEATQQGKVSGQESNRVVSVILSALNPSSLRRISPSPSP